MTAPDWTGMVAEYATIAHQNRPDWAAFLEEARHDPAEIRDCVAAYTCDWPVGDEWLDPYDGVLSDAAFEEIYLAVLQWLGTADTFDPPHPDNRLHCTYCGPA